MIPAHTHTHTHTETATVQVCAEQASFIHYGRQDIFVRENKTVKVVVMNFAFKF